MRSRFRARGRQGRHAAETDPQSVNGDAGRAELTDKLDGSNESLAEVTVADNNGHAVGDDVESPAAERDSEGSAAVEHPDPDREVTPGAGVSRSKGRGRLVVFTMLPIVALIAAAAVGFLNWQATSMQEAQRAATDSVQFATDTTIKMLSYRPDTVEQDLGAARDRLTGTFRDDYTKLTNDVVTPGAKEKKISAVATVPAVSSVSATANRAVVLVFVNQTVIVGSDPPSSAASSVRMTLQRSNGQWLVSSFDPI